ncbi:MAG: AAA family ATPase, partial [Burkholderiales bacterium]|nr:AAA family ATPase [Burkholderiales bacterium]
EKQGQFTIAGLDNPAKVRGDLFNTLNNPAKVSSNLLSDAHVYEACIDNKVILVVNIPAAARKQKPVYLNGQPLGNTYRRLHEGDRHCDDETVKRMLAEQMEDERDARILPGFSMADIDTESLRIYRQMLRDEKPAHPFLEQDDFNFLISLRGWRRDRQTGEEGLTLAGLLMFGNWLAIQEGVPNYFVDYQERPEAKAELRWVDRLVPDGSWTGNLFEFYRRVYRKLVADLKVPFALKDGQRQDDTPVHVALREALVNTLVHADYSGRLSVLVVKRPDMFGFRNPGGLRLPIEQVIRGGDSDCRNRILHQMFLLIGLGERGGSGIPKIYSGWRSCDWRPPLLLEKDEPEQTQLVLHMADLLPSHIVEQLRQRFGARFDGQDQAGRLILVTAALERAVSHNRLLEICGAHAHDLSVLLATLVRDGLLLSDGKSRGTVYFLPGETLPTPEQVFVGPNILSSVIGNMGSSSEYLEGSSEYLAGSSEYLPESSKHITPETHHQLEAKTEASRDGYGRLLPPLLDAPIIDDLEVLDEGFRLMLEKLADEPRTKAKLGQQQMERVLLTLCRDQFLTLSALASLVNRNADGLRQQYLSKMVRSRVVMLAFPTKPTHEKQAYRAVEGADSE